MNENSSISRSSQSSENQIYRSQSAPQNSRLLTTKKTSQIADQIFNLDRSLSGPRLTSNRPTLPLSEHSSKSEDISAKQGLSNEKKGEFSLSETVNDYLSDAGLTPNEIEKIESFSRNFLKNDNEKSTRYLSKEDHSLARSLVYFNEGPMKGLYVLLKDKGGVQEVGRGAYNRATAAVNLEDGQIRIFRSARKEDVLEGELEANKEVARHPNYFVAGPTVDYVGSWSPRDRQSKKRTDKALKQDKQTNKELSVNKVGILLDFLEGGDLFNLLAEDLKGWHPIQNENTLKWEIAQDIAEALDCLHTEHLTVHGDLKPENIFIDKNKNAKIADFGYAKPVDDIVNHFQGSLIYAPPEILKLGLYRNSDGLATQPIRAEASSDIWAFGCILSDLKWQNLGKWGSFAIKENNRKSYKVFLNPEALLKLKQEFFPNYNDETHIDHIIFQCLELDPKSRPTAAEIRDKLRRVTNFS